MKPTRCDEASWDWRCDHSRPEVTRAGGSHQDQETCSYRRESPTASDLQERKAAITTPPPSRERTRSVITPAALSSRPLVSRQGLPLAKPNGKPENKGAELMRSIEISLETTAQGGKRIWRRKWEISSTVITLHGSRKEFKFVSVRT